MARAEFRIGDVFERLAEIPDGSVDLVLTSPPFLALRSYLPSDHPDKAKEIGSEPTPAAFLDTLLALTAEWRRVLAPHGSICVELGDTYAGSGGAGGDYGDEGMRAGQPKFKQQPPNRSERYNADGSVRTSAAARATEDKNGSYLVPETGGAGWPMAKSLCGIPTLYAWSLAYGRNLLTGEPSPAGQWRVRNLVAWVRPNPPVGALGDKFRPATSYMTVACVGRSRYFDLDAVRMTPGPPGGSATPGVRKDTGARNDDGAEHRTNNHPAGSPPLDYWEIPTHPYPGSHYATWPPALCTRPILAMCPQRVCTTCGKASERITGDPEYIHDGEVVTPTFTRGDRGSGAGVSVAGTEAAGKSRGATRTSETLGWSDCGHDSWRPGRVLDPFAGSGTTLAVATGCGRDAIGIDLDPRNADLARDRVGMFLDVQERPLVDVPPSEEVA